MPGRIWRILLAASSLARCNLVLERFGEPCCREFPSSRVAPSVADILAELSIKKIKRLPVMSSPIHPQGAGQRGDYRRAHLVETVLEPRPPITRPLPATERKDAQQVRSYDREG